MRHFILLSWLLVSFLIMRNESNASVWISNAPSSGYNFQSSVRQQDDFVSGVSGDLGFTNTGTATQQASEANRYGVTRRDTTAVINTTASARLSATTANSISGAFTYRLTWIIRPNNLDADTYLRAGTSNPFATQPTTTGAYIEKNLVSPNWVCVTRQGGVETPTDSGVPVTSAFTTLTIIRNSASVDFYINNIYITTHTTTLPTSQTVPEVAIWNNVAASKTVDIDYFEIEITSISR